MSNWGWDTIPAKCIMALDQLTNLGSESSIQLSGTLSQQLRAEGRRWLCQFWLPFADPAFVEWPSQAWTKHSAGVGRQQLTLPLLTVPQVEIRGAPDIYVMAGSGVVLHCVITGLIEIPPFVFWYRAGQRIAGSAVESASGTPTKDHVTQSTFIGKSRTSFSFSHRWLLNHFLTCYLHRFVQRLECTSH